MEYDPTLNWNCRNADPAPEEFQRKLPLSKKQRKSVVVQSLSIDDGLNKNPRNFPSLNQRLELQKNRAAKLDIENPRFITSLKYSIKQNYIRCKLPSLIEVVNSTTMEKAMMPVEFIAQQEVVIKEETNFWKLKKREEKGYILKARGTQVTIPFEGITAFPNYVRPKQKEQDDIQELTNGMSRLRIKNIIIKKKKIVTTKTRGFTEENSDPQGVQCGARSRKEALDEIYSSREQKPYLNLSPLT